MRYVKKDVFGEAFRLNKFLEVKNALEHEGYKIHTDVYVNNMTKFMTTCRNGHPWETNWNRFQGGKRCRKCFEIKIIKSADEINEELKIKGCQLVGEYYGSEKPFKYICKCGNPSYIRIGDFRRGVRCARCAGDKIRESNRNKRRLMLDKFTNE